MRSKRIPAEEQYRLIMECRQSGLTDHQWCVEHDIKPGRTLQPGKRLRQKGCGFAGVNWTHLSHQKARLSEGSFAIPDFCEQPLNVTWQLRKGITFL